MKVLLSSNKYKAVIFDLDGVITQTAGTHAVAWKRMFDDLHPPQKTPRLF